MQHVQNRSTTSALVLTAVLIALATLFTCTRKSQYLAFAAISMLEMSLL